MSYSSRRAKRRGFDVWPGYVDALSSMLMMIALVLMVMVAAQFYLSSAINSKDIALGELALKLRQLAESLTLEQNNSKALKARKDELEASIKKDNDELIFLRAATVEKDRLIQERDALVAARDKALAEKEGLLALVRAEKDSATAEATKSKTQADALNVQIATLAKQIDELNKKLALLTADLASAKSTLLDKDRKITDLDEKLKKAMLKKVEELADYRSEFFGKLKRALGNRPEIRVVGDRFVFQSEVLFPSASADLQEGGKQELVKIADTLKEMSKNIPKEVNWILTVVGHTDKRPINTAQFPSNWELSTARALSVVKFLIETGIPAERLAATGYGEHQPIENGVTEEALSKNRRIELKFNQK
jgi:chemotaxis protein MotB